MGIFGSIPVGGGVRLGASQHVPNSSRADFARLRPGVFLASMLTAAALSKQIAASGYALAFLMVVIISVLAALSARESKEDWRTWASALGATVFGFGLGLFG